MASLFLLLAFKAGILKNPGIRFNPNGYNKDKPKLIRVSSMRYI